MCVKVPNLAKSFATLVTFVIFKSFMNTFDVYFELIRSAKSFVTYITFVIFKSFMNTFDVPFELIRSAKSFITHVTSVRTLAPKKQEINETE